MTISLKEELLRSGNVIFTNKGVSMKPLLRQGKDLMIIEAGKGKEMRPAASICQHLPFIQAEHDHHKGDKP